MVRLNSSLSSLVARRKSPMARPIWPMISGSLAGPNTIKARTTIRISSIGPIPRKFIAAGLCPPNVPSVDYKPLRAREHLLGEAADIGSRDPHLSLCGPVRLCHALQDVLPSFRIELRQKVIKQNDWELAELGPHPFSFRQLQRQHR